MFEGHQDLVLDVDVSPDGRFAASVSGGDHEDGKWAPGDDFSVRIWRLPQVSTQPREGLRLANLEGGPGGEYSKLGGIKDEVLALDLSEDGQLIATGEKNGTVRIWELEANRTIARLTPHNDLVRAVAFSPDGKRLWSRELTKSCCGCGMSRLRRNC